MCLFSESGALKIYLDTFDMEVWQNLMPTGLFHGITTNPLLASRAGLCYRDINWPDIMQTAASLDAKELHVQVPDTSDEALRFAAQKQDEAQSIGLKLVVKIPITREGIHIAKVLKAQKYNILMTACYHAKQYIVATQLSADYIAPYYGRMNEAGIDAKQHLMQMHAMANSTSSTVRILVASLRSVDQMVELAAEGLTHFTIAPAIAKALLQDDLTYAATAEFIRAANGK